MSLDVLLQRADLWRGGGASPAAGEGLASGFPELDASLPGGGWPRAALTEILASRQGSGGLSLVLPALARLSRRRRWLAWVAPPHVPYAPALARAGVELSRVLLVHPRTAEEGLWAVEQALRSGTCSAVLAWLEGGGSRGMRRLQLAAEAGGTWGVLFRPARAAREASPAALRLRLEPAPRGVAVHILKRRGGWATGPLRLELDRVMAVPASSPTAAGDPYPGRGR